MKYSIKQMRRFVTALALFAMAVSLCAQTSSLWAKKIDGTPLIICSSFGERIVLVDSNGQALPDVPDTQPSKKHCSLCGVLDSLIAPPDLVFTALYREPLQLNLYKHIDVSLKVRLSHQAHGIRAPPNSSVI